MCLLVLLAFGGIPKFDVTEVETGLQVGYSVKLADVNGDGRLDIIVLDAKRVIWYENPTWKPHIVLDGETVADNVCMAPLDINGDGKLDLAIGAGWLTSQSYTHNLFWLEQTAPDRPWRLHQIGLLPHVHRMLWMDVAGDGRPELVCVPLWGPGKPAERQANPVPIMAFEIPRDPVSGRWREHVLSNELHVAHNFMFRRNADGAEMIVASFEGLTLYPVDKKTEPWPSARIVDGDQQSKPNKGCSEIAEGRRASGARMFATIEPWHGNQVVVYTPTSDAKGWKRTVVDKDLQWGHAAAWADLDGDGNDELIVGVRDDKSPEHRRGVRVYSFQDDNGVLQASERLDAGGVAVEDLAIGDLDGDGRPDIVVSGRATRNVRIYWNQGR